MSPLAVVEAIQPSPLFLSPPAPLGEKRRKKQMKREEGEEKEKNEKNEMLKGKEEGEKDVSGVEAKEGVSVNEKSIGNDNVLSANKEAKNDKDVSTKKNKSINQKRTK
ncbi:uncharacterized protein MONOS_18507 [Monocercomonoides exilis]|uniref:uncharacterized protein n=1 Tax=Monocercomonoides exilis TaxID=2049356 RepID=UPI003559F736|nr:hypothetical protein MONOS_18507 [Monocercomonoides exilis]